jgi:hypothetical protein
MMVGHNLKTPKQKRIISDFLTVTKKEMKNQTLGG